MPSEESARSVLRSATAGHHERVDGIFSRADLADRDGYGRFLLAQAGAHITAEDALTRAGAGSVLADWTQRHRAGLLRSDLAALGLAAPPPMEAGAFDSPAAVLGGVYVLEGSRLGGRLLRRAVPPHLPSSFLGAGDPAAWRRLLAVLDERLVGADERDAAVDAAIAVFTLFERSGRRYLEAA